MTRWDHTLSFSVCGHDRGGGWHTGWRWDHPQRVQKLCVLDNRADAGHVRRDRHGLCALYFHWFLLIQPGAAAVNNDRPERARLAALRVGKHRWRRLSFVDRRPWPNTSRCFCAPNRSTPREDYRASAGIDLELTREPRAGREGHTRLLALCGERGVVQRLFDPQALWQAQLQRPGGSAFRPGRLHPGRTAPGDGPGAARVLPLTAPGKQTFGKVLSTCERYATLALCAAGLLASIGWALYSGRGWLLILLFALLVAVGVHDLRQRRHAILRNYPVIGHMRFLFEFIRPEIRQYFIEAHGGGAFSRAQRSWGTSAPRASRTARPQMM